MIEVAWILAVSASGGWLVTEVLRRVAPVVGWLDPRPGTPGFSAGAGAGSASPTLERKQQRLPAAPVGGLSLLLVGVMATATLEGALGVETRMSPGALLSLVAACLVGFADDWIRVGLSPAQKLVGQVACTLPFAVEAGEPIGALGRIALGLVAMNLINTFDNSDGAAASLPVVAAIPAVPALAGALLGFLPANSRRPREESGGVADDPAPQAYLGDSGSHLLGLWLALEPTLWPLLALPGWDLLRVVVLRIRAAQAPWVGDRRHLPQVLERRGWSTPHRILVFAGISAIACAPPWFVDGAQGIWAGLAAGSVASLALLAATTPVVRDEP